MGREYELLRILPDTYEVLDILRVPSGLQDCKDGEYNTVSCADGTTFRNCSSGGCYRG